MRKTLWLTPGGELKEQESYQQALERELFEELGLCIKVEDESVLSLDVPIGGGAERDLWKIWLGKKTF